MVLDGPARTEMSEIATQEVLPLEDPQATAFDEMNIVEIPFALLANKTSRKSIALSISGHERLVADDYAGALPTALAERVILGLMWYAKQTNGFSSPVIRFSLRRLITDYVFPGRFLGGYTPNQSLFSAVETQILRVAHTRIVSDRWYDRREKRHVPIDASIIDYIKVVQKGGASTPKILEIRWGALLFESIRNHYTKPIDIDTYQRIERPLDRRFYRWLDRQLAEKPRQEVPSCQCFAKYKLAMSSSTLEKGGRTASSYVTNQLEGSLKRLSDLGFGVLMHIDRSKLDYRLTFIRLGHTKANEVVIEDQAANLVGHFQFLNYGLPPKTQHVSARDREAAERWIKMYGLEKARGMVERCLVVAKEQPKPIKILKFVGLDRFEQAAASDCEEHGKGQLSLQFAAKVSSLWELYELTIRKALRAEEKERFRQEAIAYVHALPIKVTTSKETIIRAEAFQRERKHLGMLCEEEFRLFTSEEVLREALIGRHGFDPLSVEGS